MKKHSATKKISLALLAIVMIISVAFGCSSSSDKNTASPSSPQKNSYGEAGSGEWTADTSYYDKAAPTPMPAATVAPSDGTHNSILVPDPSRKMIWNGDLELETTSFDAAVSALYSLIEECGGFIQSSSVTGEGRNVYGEPRLRNGRYTVRIPTENFQLFMKSSGNVATVIRSNTNAEDVSSQYFDTEARLKVLQLKEERLMEMLEQTGKADYEDELKYILQIESELSNVRYEIESLTGTLRKYDNLISYSTVTVYLNEVREYTATPAEPESFGKRIADKFTSGVRGAVKVAGDILILITGFLPYLAMLAVIAAAIYFPVRLLLNRAKNSRSKPHPKSPENSPSSGDGEI